MNFDLLIEKLKATLEDFQLKFADLKAHDQELVNLLDKTRNTERLQAEKAAELSRREAAVQAIESVVDLEKRANARLDAAIKQEAKNAEEASAAAAELAAKNADYETRNAKLARDTEDLRLENARMTKEMVEFNKLKKDFETRTKALLSAGK